MRSTMKKYALVVPAVAALVAVAGIAQAQVSGDDAKCRAAFQKTLAKYNDTVHKTIAGCWKDVLKGKRLNTTDCNDIGTADTKNKAGKAQAKLEDTVGGIKTKCDDTVHTTALAEFSANGCPSPAAGPISTWTEARDCALAITQFQAAQVWNHSFDPDSADVDAIIADKDLGKCSTTIHKSIIKLASTAGKERGKDQAGSDKAGGSYDFLSGNADPKSKIAGSLTKLNDGIDKACVPKGFAIDQADLARMRSCRADIDGLKDCLGGPWERNGSAVTSMAFEQAGICPSSVVVAIDAGKGDDVRINETQLDSGWSGLGHDVDVSDGFVGSVAISCADSTCGSCTPTLECDPQFDACRCSNDVTQSCSTPNVESTCGGGNTCEVFFGPPLPLNASNTPVCAVNKIPNELGSVVPADIGTGEATTTVNSVTLVHTGISQEKPCPVCENDTTANDGSKDGTCDGGPRDGLSCDANGSHPAFGVTSFDCQPDTGANVSGSGLQIGLTLSNGPSSLPEGTDCTFGGGGSGLTCACAVCTGGGNIPCNDDADCPGLETCSSAGSGNDTQPNACSDLVCTAGECLGGGSGDTVNFCEGFTRGDGTGILVCSSNAECTALDPICPNGNCGNCSLSTIRPCFTSGMGGTIDISGQSGTDSAVLSSTFCIPPTSSSSINSATGLPGPARIATVTRFTGRCANGTPWQFPGGSNCQP